MADIPTTLEEAVAAFTKLEDAEEWGKSLNVEAAVAAIHHVGGRHIRNEWGLWLGSALARHLHERFGLAHADDMSGLILHCAYQELNGKPWGAEEVVAGFKAYWEAQGGQPKPTWPKEPKKASAVEDVVADIEKAAAETVLAAALEDVVQARVQEGLSAAVIQLDFVHTFLEGLAQRAAAQLVEKQHPEECDCLACNVLSFKDAWNEIHKATCSAAAKADVATSDEDGGGA